MLHAVSWNLTPRCNLDCAHCYLDASRRAAPHPGALSKEESLRVLDDLASLNPHLVLILTGGEPLLHPDLVEIVERASKLGMTPVLGTNGTLIRPDVAERLRDAGLRGWGVSLDSVSPGAHDRLRGVGGAWRRAVRGLGVLRNLGVPFVIQPSIFSWNRHEVAALANLALELGAVGINYYFLVCTGRGQAVTDISPESYEECLREITRLQGELAERLMVNAKCAPHQNRVTHQRDGSSRRVSGYPGGCPAALHYLRIGPEGEVSACPYVPARGASIRSESLRLIWNENEQLTRLRDRAALGGRCGSCEFREICGGCRARALARSGDLLAEDPACLHIPGDRSPAALEPEQTYGGPIRFRLRWTADARARLDALPSFLTSMVVARVERAAREARIDEVTTTFLKTVRSRGAQAGLGGMPPDGRS